MEVLAAQARVPGVGGRVGLAYESQLAQYVTLELARGASASFEPQEARAPAEFAGGARAPSPVAARPDGRSPYRHRRRPRIVGRTRRLAGQGRSRRRAAVGTATAGHGAHAAEAVEVVAQLVAIERALATLAPVGNPEP